MATITIDCEYCGDLKKHSNLYVAVHDATEAFIVHDSATTFTAGQDKGGYSGSMYYIWRMIMKFDLSSLPDDISITGATLKLYGNTDYSTTDFDVTVVEVVPDPDDPLAHADYSKLDTTDLGHLSTGSCSTSAYNDITINVTGRNMIYNRLQENTTLYLGVRSAEDISASSPAGAEYFIFQSWSSSNPPQIEITYYSYEDDVFPSAPSFPTLSRVSSNTQSLIQSYIEDMTEVLGSVVDTSSNIDLSTDKTIKWGGATKISWDSVNSRVVFDSLAIDNSITVADDFVVEATATFGSLTAATASVGTYWSTVGTLYASDIKGSVTDNELVFTETGQVFGTEAKAKMYYYSTDNALRVNLYPTGESAKVGVLADWDLL